MLADDGCGDRSRQFRMVFAVVGMDEVERRRAEAGSNRMARELFPCPVEERPPTASINAEDHVSDILDDRPVASLAVMEGLACRLGRRDGQLEPRAMAVQHEPDQPGDGSHGRDPQRDRDLGRQVGTGGRQLDHDGRRDADEEGSHEGGDEPPAVEERESEGHCHDRRCRERRNRRRDGGRDQDEDEHGGDEKKRRAPGVAPGELPASVEQENRKTEHDGGTSGWGDVAGLENDDDADQREEQRDTGHGCNQPRQFAGLIDGHVRLAVGTSVHQSRVGRLLPRVPPPVGYEFPTAGYVCRRSASAWDRTRRTGPGCSVE